MSNAHLPDDLKQWPDDPFQVLGLTPEASLRDVRRAYANLIRIYKPETSPVHFRRIRDAYELLQHYYSTREATPVEAAAELAAVAGATTARPLHEDLTELWRQSRTAEPVDAYRRFAELASQSSGHEDLYLRLFWLRTLWPGLDPQRQPIDWLYAGFQTVAAPERICALYAVELLHHPEECLSRRCQSLLDLLPRSEFVYNVAVVRWQEAGVRCQWPLIADDLERLRLRFGGDLHAWANLLLAAIDQLAWRDSESDHPTAAALFAEAEKRTAGQLEFSEALARRDALLELVGEWRKLPYRPALPREFRETLGDVLRRSWNQPGWSFHWDVLRFLAPWVANPHEGLELLDRLHQTSRILLSALTDVTANIYADRANEPEEGDREQMARELCLLVKSHFAGGYAAMRLPLMYFCAHWRQTCRTAASLLFAVQGPPQFEEVGNQLGQDLALHALCFAQLAFDA